MDASLDQLPGFRRRFRITPAAGMVQAAVEDDFHRMQVTIRHRDGVALSIESDVLRAPWTTCPSASDQLVKTFTNVALTDFATRGEKRANCTHLHDLATLAAAHAADREPLVYDILVSDVFEGRRGSELRRNGESIMRWTLNGMKIERPAELAGAGLDQLGPWIASLEPPMQEAARVFRWGNMIAHGRAIPLAQQSDAMRMPLGNCYSFQPERRTHAQRVGEIRDFSRAPGAGRAQPLADMR